MPRGLAPKENQASCRARRAAAMHTQPWSFSEEAAAEKHMASAPAQHVGDELPVGGAFHYHRRGQMDRDDHTRRRALPALSGDCGAPVLAVRPDWRNAASIWRRAASAIEAVRVVDMSESNSWAEFAGLFCATRSAFLDHERARSELKALMPEDAKEASGHGVRAKRSKSGAVSDEYTVPVCRLHHRDLHAYGYEASWWAGVGIDPLPIALELWRRSRLTYSLAATWSEPCSTPSRLRGRLTGRP